MSLSYTPNGSELEIAPPSHFELLWLNHRNALLAGIAAFVVLVLIVAGVFASLHTSQIASETLLSNASNDAGWREVIAKYPRTPATADAMLLLAASLREAGKIEESDSLYSQVAESFPKSPLVISGLLGRAANARAANHPDTAVNDYQQAAAQFPMSYGAPFALISEAQLLVRLDRTEEAKRVIDSLRSQYPGSAAAQAFGGSLSAQKN
jgi:TolA-binding protein